MVARKKITLQKQEQVQASGSFMFYVEEILQLKQKKSMSVGFVFTKTPATSRYMLANCIPWWDLGYRFQNDSHWLPKKCHGPYQSKNKCKSMGILCPYGQQWSAMVTAKAMAASFLKLQKAAPGSASCTTNTAFQHERENASQAISLPRQ